MTLLVWFARFREGSDAFLNSQIIPSLWVTGDCMRRRYFNGVEHTRSLSLTTGNFTFIRIYYYLQKRMFVLRGEP